VVAQYEEVALVQAQWVKQNAEMQHHEFVYLFIVRMVMKVDQHLQWMRQFLMSGIVQDVVGQLAEIKIIHHNLQKMNLTKLILHMLKKEEMTKMGMQFWQKQLKNYEAIVN
jgi:hypothetical protein